MNTNWLTDLLQFDHLVPHMDSLIEEATVSRRVVSFVVPLGDTINMNGTALYQAIAAIFIAQTYGIEMGLGTMIIVLLTATLSAIGAAGIPEARLVTMVIVLKAVDLPIKGILLILVVDWFGTCQPLMDSHFKDNISFT